MIDKVLARVHPRRGVEAQNLHRVEVRVSRVEDVYVQRHPAAGLDRGLLRHLRLLRCPIGCRRDSVDGHLFVLRVVVLLLLLRLLLLLCLRLLRPALRLSRRLLLFVRRLLLCARRLLLDELARLVERLDLLASRRDVPDHSGRVAGRGVGFLRIEMALQHLARWELLAVRRGDAELVPL